MPYFAQIVRVSLLNLIPMSNIAVVDGPSDRIPTMQ